VILTVPFLFFPSAGEMAEQTLDFVGNVACGYMAFVLPIILYWKIYGFTPEKGEVRSMTDRVMPFLVLVLGFYTVVIATSFTVLEWCGVEWVQAEMPHPPAIQKAGL